MEDSQESFLVYCSFTVLRLYSLWLPIKFPFIRKIYILSFLVLKKRLYSLWLPIQIFLIRKIYIFVFFYFKKRVYIPCGCRFNF